MPTFFFSPPFHICYHALKYSYAKFLQFFVGRSPVFSLQPATLWIDSSWSWFWGLCNGILVSRILEFKQLKLLYFFYLAVSSFLSLFFKGNWVFILGEWWVVEEEMNEVQWWHLELFSTPILITLSKNSALKLQ